MKWIYLASCLFFLMVSVVHAGYYKCTDEDGNITISDTPTSSYCEAIFGDMPRSYQPKSSSESRSRTTGLSQEEVMKLGELSSRAMSLSEEGSSAARRACYFCMAVVIDTVKARGKAVNPKFWGLVDYVLDFKEGSSRKLYQAIQRAAYAQSIDVSDIGACKDAQFRTY
jgi:hypothetical protein